MTATVAIPAARLFGNEIRQAKQLGYHIGVHITEHAAVVRLTAKSQRAKRTAAEHGGAAIESTVPYDRPRDRADALHAALMATLQLARDAA